MGRLLGIALRGDSEEVMAGLREEGFLRPRATLDADLLLAYLSPFLDPARVERFQFSREWLRAQAARLSDPRSPAATLGLQLNLPPSYLMIHRVWLGGVGVLSQLGAEAPWLGEMQRWLPGFRDAAPAL